ncbi:MAG: cation:proton antiporter [Deltaproteobacteria bacterium]|nr:cation:proton antiporter [Deltaproteobacteria bacterium]MBW2053490.1 cation:proton antiporter [Deltaproteobacteria bacterium]MBW2140867.1 cation:proton antiporter [Deltaproteobacteria bacterium]MBW2323105.1 cation:proton antiporter [Deltaproteobacteria bacterium]
MITSELVIDMLLILTVAWIFGYIFTRFGLPLMLGQLLAGLIIGPPLLGWISASSPLELMANFGLFFLMFYTGMELQPRELFEHIWIALATAVGGFVLPFSLGFLVTWLFGGTVLQSLFVGMCISVTAVAVQSMILQNMRINKTELGHIVIGAAILDDILALICLSVLFGYVRTGTVIAGEIFFILAKIFIFFGITVILGQFVLPRLTRRVIDKDGYGFTFGMTIALAMAYLAELAGLQLIIGAFFAGLLVRSEIMDESVFRAIADRFFDIAYGFLLPIFFVSLSFHLQFEWSWFFLAFAFILTLAGFAGKFLGSGIAIKFFGHSTWEAAVVGFGMNGRGVVELVLATLAMEFSRELMAAGTITEPLLTQWQFSALIFLAFITKLLSPLSLKWSVRRGCQPGEYVNYCQLLETAPKR